MTELPPHIPVLLDEVLTHLAPAPGETYADATAGLGGHAEAVARRLGPTGMVIVNDADPANLAHAEARVRALPGAPRVASFRGNFADLPRHLADAGFRADMLLADLGFSSCQMDAPARGFSFSREGPLDMRLDPSSTLTAGELVNSASEPELVRILRDFGEEPAAVRIARKLVRARSTSPISTTVQLAQLVRDAVGGPPPGVSRIDPATRTFQALRIAVNDELGSLEALLRAVRDAAGALAGTRGGSWLTRGARVAIISFHSLEDRLVKRAFAALVADGLARPLTDAPVVAGPNELNVNPRSRSAKLRAVRVGAQTGLGATGPGPGRV